CASCPKPRAPEDWRSYATASEEDDLSDKVVGDVLQKLNSALKQHNRIVYSSQAIQHVAQQIASLYWTSVNDAIRDQNSFERGIEKTVDLSNHLNLTQLPVELEDQSASEEERLRYQKLRERLVTLDNQRQQRRRRLEQLRRLQRLLEPFQEPQQNIQPNLITRDGELVQELEKMRMLVARVGGRIQHSKKRFDSQEDPASYQLDSDRKLEVLLDMTGTGFQEMHSRMLTALEGDPEDRNSASESPMLDQFGDSEGDTGDEQTTTPSHTVRFLLPVSLAHSPAIITDSVVAPNQPTIIGETTPETPARRSFVPGHRRRSTHVTRLDLERFRRDVLGIDTPGFGFDDEASLPAVDPSVDPQLESLNRDFDAVARSMNSGSTPDSGSFSSGVDNASNASNQSNMTNVPRQSMSPAMSHTPSQVNGAGIAGMNAGIPLNAGHQMDLHHLAEEVMRRSASEGTSPSVQQVNGEISAARITELERALTREKRLNEVLRNEQEENTKLIGEYEQAVGTMVEQIRNYCQNNNLQYLAQKRHYNNLLQNERDAHLQSRLERDHWHNQTMKCAEMIRTAYRIRCEEENVPIRVVAGLQNEVRAYRNALGMEPERPEEEYGWEILKDVPGGPAPGQ
ncbi:hypothetical protein AARAC_006829, partial [Aspergillus arachidicola]